MSGSAESHGRPLMVGSTLGGYSLVREIGRGGMGAVYFAEHSRIVRQAAVKVLLPGAAASPEAVQRFFAEARAASMIRHPGIIEVFDCDVDDASGAAFIVMEHLQGVSLRQFIKEDLSRDLSSFVDIGTQVARAMAAAHERGIVHRDLKPDNVFLCRDSAAAPVQRVKLLDFGIAKLLAAGAASLTTDGIVFGTPRYMSPEQCLNSREVGPGSDIYSLGCILFEMACGRPPFDADGATALLIAHVSQPPPQPAALNSRLPAALDALILQMLAKAPESRPRSMQEVETRLRQLLPGATPSLSSAAAAVDLAPTWQGDPTLPGSRQRAAEVALAPTVRAQPLPAQASRPYRYALVAAAGLLALALPAWILMSRAREARVAEARAARARLDSGLSRAAEIPAPAACRTSDGPTLVRLADAVDALQPAAGEADARTALARLETAGAAAEEWAMRARAHLAASQDTDALAAAERALAICPGYASAHYLAGKAADRLGRRDRAAHEYRQALTADVGFIPPRYNLALLQMKSGDSTSAAATLDVVVSRRADARALLLRAQARLDTANLAGAESDLRKVVRLQPALGDGWALLGTVHARKAEYAEAMRAFCRAKELGSAAGAANCRE